MTSYWTRPLSVALETAASAFQHALQAGDFQIACYCCSHIVTDRLAVGHPLDEVYQESVARLDFARKAGFQAVQDVIHHIQRYVQQLRGLLALVRHAERRGLRRGGLRGRAAAGTHEHHAVLVLDHQAAVALHVRRLRGGARGGEPRPAELTWSSLGHIQLLDFHLYRALALAACLPASWRRRSSSSTSRPCRSTSSSSRSGRAHCPENFRAPERMVSAELARLLGRREEALRAYEEAIHSAREHGFIQNVALASELAARFWRERQVPTLARRLCPPGPGGLPAAGAPTGKVRHLDAQWPHAGPPRGTAPDDRLRHGHGPTQLDALTVVKAQQAISGEIVLERLAATLLRVATENAGAQRGALLLPHGDKLTVVALAGASRGLRAARTRQPLPWTPALLRQAHARARAHRRRLPAPPLLVRCLPRSAARPARCSACRCCARRSSAGCCTWRTPSPPTPSPRRASSLLGQLASQAAISLENARLYADVQRAEAALRQRQRRAGAARGGADAGAASRPRRGWWRRRARRAWPRWPPTCSTTSATCSPAPSSTSR